MVDRIGPAVRWCPTTWFVCFHEKTDRKWLDRLIFGRFKHVSAFGWVPGPNVVVFVEHCAGILFTEALPDDGGSLVNGRIKAMTEGAVVVQVARSFGETARWRPILSCVSVTAHLLGIRSSALRPDGLLRDCLRVGGTVLEIARNEDEHAGPVAGG